MRRHDADRDPVARIGAGERVDDVERRLAGEVLGDLLAEPLERVLGELLVPVPPDPALGARLADDELVLRRAAGVPAGVDDERAALADARLAARDRVLVEQRGRGIPDDATATG